MVRHVKDQSAEPAGFRRKLGRREPALAPGMTGAPYGKVGPDGTDDPSSTPNRPCDPGLTHNGVHHHARLRDQEDSVHRRLSAPQMRDRHLHPRHVCFGGRPTAGCRVLRRARQRSSRGIRVSAGGPVRDRRAGSGQLSESGRLPELRQHRRRLPPARVRNLRRPGRQSHPRLAEGSPDAGRHDLAHRPPRTGRGSAARPDATGGSVGPRRRHDRTSADVSPGNLRGFRSQD